MNRPLNGLLFPRLVAIATLLAANGSVFADQGEEFESDQPIQELFQTEAVYPQEKGELQFTIAPSWHQEQDRDLLQLPMLIEYGLTDSWQIGAHWDSWVYSDPKAASASHRTGNAEVETKYSFLNIDGSDFHVALGFGVEFPLGSVNDEISDGFIEYEPFVVVAKDFPSLRQLQLFGQVGLSLAQRLKSPDDPADREPAAHEFFCSGGFFLPANRFVISGELTWSNNEWNHGGEENELYITPGLTCKLPRRWEIGIGVPIGLTDDSDRLRLIFQMTKEF